MGLVLLFLLMLAGQTDSAQRHFLRGVERHKVSDWNGAREAYESALGLAPKRVDVLSNLGLVLVRLSKFDEAIKRFEAALAIEPNQVAVRLNLGIACFHSGRFEAAVAELQRVLQLQPEHSAA